MGQTNASGGCLGVVGVLVLFAVVGMFLPKGDSSPSSASGNARGASHSRSEGGDESGAWSAARSFVEGRLKNPASADFPWYDKDAIQFLGNATYRIKSYVDASNSFGGTIRTDYVCTVRLEGDTWTLQGLSMH